VAGNKAAFDAAMARAQSYAFSDAWDKALREYQRAVEEFPQDAQARTNLAQALFRLQRWPAALAAYQDLLPGRPSDPFVLNRIAECQSHLGQAEAAEQTYLQVAQIYSAQNQMREALAALRSILQINPANRAARARMADVYRALGETALAIQELLTLSHQALDPPLNDLGEAVRQAEAAFALDNSHAQARGWLHDLRRRQADTTGATYDEKTLRIVGAAPQTAALDLDQMYDLAVQYQEKGQFTAARVQFEAAYAAGLDTPGVHYNLGLLYQQSELWGKAVEQFEQALSDPEFTMSTHFALGECYRAMKRLPDSTRAFEAAVNMVDLQKVGKSEIPDLMELYRAAADANIAEGNAGRAAGLYQNLAGFLQTRRWRTGYTEELASRARELGEEGMNSRLRGMGGPVAPPEPPAPEAPAPAPAPSRLATPPPTAPVRPLTDFIRDAAPAPAPAHGGDEVITSPLPGEEGAARDHAALPGATAGAAPPPRSAALRELLADGGVPLDAAARAALADVDALMARQAWMAAVDSAYEVIRLEPEYLPVHLRLAHIYAQLGRPEDAIAKLQSVIDVYQVRGEPAAAARVYPELIALQPENVNIRTKLATLLVDLGRPDDAVNAYLDLADMYYSTGQRERALDELRRLRGLAPQNAEVRLRAGLYLLRSDRPADALPEFTRALQFDPANRLALARVFVSMVLLGNDTAWDVLETILTTAAAGGDARQVILEDLRSFALTADRPELFYALALLHEQETGAAGAAHAVADQVDALDRGLALLPVSDPNPLGALMAVRRAQLALAAKDGATAVTLLTAALAAVESGRLAPSPRPTLPFLRLPAAPEIAQPLAQAYVLTGDNGKALTALQAAKAGAPDDPDINALLAELYIQEGRLGAALVALDELIGYYQNGGQIEKVIETLGYMARLAPNNITVRQKLADTYLKIGYIDLGLSELEILAELQRKAGLVKDAVKSFQRRADVYWQMGQLSDAFATYERILRMAPGDVEARQQLIHLYITTGRISEATREQKRIAEIYLQQRRAKDAIAALHELIALAPNDTESYYALAEVLAEQHEYGQAARLYGRLRRLEPAKDAALAQLQSEMQQQAQEHAGGSRAGQVSGR
jgi:tetratricopeptide (TPR) repeat protein